MKIAVIGGGSWATALIKLLSDREFDEKTSLCWWVRRKETVEYIRRYGHNPDYLSSVSIPLNRVQVTNELENCISGSELVILAIPSAFLQEQLAALPQDVFEGKYVASAIKGVIPQTYEVVGSYLKTRFQVPEERILVISGPCHAEEVALEKLSFLTIASGSEHSAHRLASLLESRYLKTKTSNDLYGVEYGAVLKNVYAIASGICHGLGYGDNFQSVLMCYAVKEMKYFMDRVSPMSREISDHVYLGDLLVTAYSQFSRNRSFGMMIGKGYSVISAQMEMNMIAEGYYATRSMHEFVEREDLSMPILEAVYDIIYDHENAREVMRNLIATFD